MTPAAFLATILDPGLAWCAALPGWRIPASDRARVLLLAIAGQESDWRDIQQFGDGPGAGPWQFEPETISEILHNPASRDMALAVCRAVYLVPVAASLHVHIIADPNLAVAFARLDLWCDAAPLPPLFSSYDAWESYLRIWRPGTPRPDRWEAIWEGARDAVLLKPPAPINAVQQQEPTA